MPQWEKEGTNMPFRTTHAFHKPLALWHNSKERPPTLPHTRLNKRPPTTTSLQNTQHTAKITKWLGRQAQSPGAEN